MILVLCDETDIAALWATDALRRRGLSPRLLTGRELADVHGWRHTIGAAGVETTLRLDGHDLRGDQVHGVLNRLAFLPQAWLATIGGADRDYAVQEMVAFYLSWLHALAGPKLNPPTPQGLCGNLRHPSAWIALGVRAGLPVRRFRQTSEDDPAIYWQKPDDPAAATVFVVGDAVIGPAALLAIHRDACLRFSNLAECPLLGIDFAPDIGGTWRMIAASVTPDLMRGGEALADALAATLAP